MVGRVICRACAWFALASLAQGAETSKPSDSAAKPVDFARDIQPLLAKRCYSCHGPEQAEASLRLDRKADALRGGNSGPAFVPGHSADSRLVKFVAGTSDDDMIMPPEGERLSTTEVAMIRTWIDSGATWPEEPVTARTSTHWAFRPIKNCKPPDVAATRRVRNGIDRFVLAKLAAKGIHPSPEANRATLIRRLSLDLLGLPPTPAEVDDFVNDRSRDAYDRLVDRLLASPHYGERWARHWLDLARYADSDGYEKDTGRPHAWRYRQWVIDALNRDLPFDQFTIEQLAGDLLPGATVEQRVATGFHRNTLTNREGGVDQEQFRVAATVDRVNTTGTVWLGLTVGCAQCHTHKYDPILQREYYGLFAFFNSLQETETPAPLPAQLEQYQQEKRAFDAEHAKLTTAVKQFEADRLPDRLAAWERRLKLPEQTEWEALDPRTMTGMGGGKRATLTHLGSGVVAVAGDNPPADNYTLTAEPLLRTITALRLEVLADPELPGHGPGRSANGNFVLTELRAFKVAPASKKKESRQTAVAIRTGYSDVAQQGFPLQEAFDGKLTSGGWAIAPATGRDHVAVFEFTKPIVLNDRDELSIVLSQQYKGEHTLGRFRLSVTNAATPVRAQGAGPNIADILDKPAEQRTAAEQAIVTAYYRKLDPELSKLDLAVSDHARRAPIDPQQTVKAQTLNDLKAPRETHVLVRGDFLRPGAKVDPHTLEVLNPLKPSGTQPTRLDLAHWLIDPKNPLTARVTVNRIWATYFGRGLVPTVDDFGTQGDKPSHPELLDWLAANFIRGVEDRGLRTKDASNQPPVPSPQSPASWGLKALHKLIVTSATYRQASHYRADLAERDPLNTLLARQRRLRVEAEVVRDLSLAASGLLDERVGGESVRPRQPQGIAELTYAGVGKWIESTGSDRYRRGLYTWFQRTAPYPMLMTFDAPDSNVTCARRERSNTPLQALTLLNDPVFFECAQSLARRIVRESPQADDPAATRDARLRYAMKLCVARDPSAAELGTLRSLLDEQRQLMLADENAAKEVIGSEPAPEGIGADELAAWIIVGRTLMNLDEFITRE
ncbi:MAG TPA: PSD1 and planctomycete cytochrome C domain-containing protein [Pirellulales bacterium]|jgi:hypothetical protein|nr:PSD1 and planctomycete cytochrome C domain-containing protein [Pirellulales bacterium]